MFKKKLFLISTIFIFCFCFIISAEAGLGITTIPIIPSVLGEPVNQCSDAFNRSVCKEGYEKVNCECVKKCEFGSVRSTNNVCEKVNVPNNAKLTEDGKSWECLEGYDSFNGECLTSCGSWEYRDSNGNCEYITYSSIPENSYPLPIEGKCARGYILKGTIPFKMILNNYNSVWCEPVVLPHYAYYFDNENGWMCKDGFVEQGEECVCPSGTELINGLCSKTKEENTATIINEKTGSNTVSNLNSLSRSQLIAILLKLLINKNN
ncbi:MAG TPA: hypothetical protein PKU93_00540 [Candidatus Pacearchaeota archaeon]|nr:hypothetical protein [Candidatus Pacearchaeota archaeon]